MLNLFLKFIYDEFPIFYMLNFRAHTKCYPNDLHICFIHKDIVLSLQTECYQHRYIYHHNDYP